jgi:hypothetical protein
MPWQSNPNFQPTDFLDAADLNNLANDIRSWGGDVNGGGHTLSNVIISGSVTAGMPDPTQALGDLIVRGSSPPPTRLAIGTNGQVLTADSNSPLGMKWANNVATPPVSSVFGRTGAIVAANHDYNVSQIDGALADPTQNKGDLIVRGSAVTNLVVGSDGQVLTADSTTALGVKWAAPVGQVTSVFGRTGAVVAAAGDYTAAQVTGAVPNTVQVIAGAGMSGGGSLSASVTLNALVTSVFGRTGAVVLTASDISAGGGVPATRQVLAGAGMSGGGTLGADITLSAAVTSVFGRTGAVALQAADITGVGGVLSSRQIIAGSGLTQTPAGSDLSVDRTLSIVPKTVNQLVAVAYAGTVQGIRPTVNFVSGGGLNITVADDSTTNSVDVTLGVSSASVGVSVDSNPIVGPRPTLHFISGSNAAISASDNSTNNRIDITVSASISGSAGAQTPWVTNVDAASYQLANVSFIGVNRPADSSNAHISINSTVTDGLRISNSTASALAQASLINSDSSAKLILIASGSTAAANPSTAEINTVGPLLLATNGLEAMRISTVQRVLIGTKTDDGSCTLQVNGWIRSVANGFKFPDNTVQTTAAVSGMNDPTTTKGDLIIHNATNQTVRLAVGADNLVLTADSTSNNGVSWKAAAGGVASVFGRTGAVVAAAGDYTVGQVTGAVPNTVQIIAGAGLSGGGTLPSSPTGSVTLSVTNPNPWLSGSGGVIYYNSGRVLIGTATDDGVSQLQINTTATTSLSAITANNQNLANFYSYSGSGQNFGLQLRGNAARGTPAAPAALAQSDWIESLISWGWDGSVWGRGPSIQMLADSNWTTTSHGSLIVFSVVPQGSSGAPPEAMRITSAGLVGIGTTAPPNLLSVSSAGVSTYLNVGSFLAAANTTVGNATVLEVGVSEAASNCGQFRFVYAGAGSVSNRIDLGFFGSSNPVLAALAGGNVGISTTTPQTNLDVAGSIRVTQQGNLATSGQGLTIFYNQSNSRGRILSQDAGSGAYQLLMLDGSVIALNSGGGNAGAVGIGTNTPAGSVDVAGAASNWICFRPNVGGANANPPAAANYGLLFGWNSSGGNGESQILFGTSVAGSSLQFGRWSGSVKSIDLTIYNGGNVGVANSLQVGNSAYVNQAGDIGVSRNGATTTGAIYFGSGGSHYIYFDGTNWNFVPALPSQAFGAWASYTPTVTDGTNTLATTNMTAYYATAGTGLIVQIYFNIAALPANMYVSLPVTVVATPWNTQTLSAYAIGGSNTYNLAIMAQASGTQIIITMSSAAGGAAGTVRIGGVIRLS